MFALFYRLPRHLTTIFSGRNLAWHGLAIGLTMLILMSGFDWTWYRWTRGDDYVRLAWPAIVLGGLVPLLGLPALLLGGWVAHNRRFLASACALGQAALLAYLITSGYKAITGRIPPPFAMRLHGLPADQAAWVDTSHGFQFGLLRGGIFWGWPSGHTTVAFAMTTCLIALFPRARPRIWLALIYPLFIGLSVSVSIHWFSEFVAGAIIGSVVGTVVGKGFREGGQLG